MRTPIYFVDKDNAIFELSKFASFNESFDDPRCTAAVTADDRTFIINADLSLVSKALFDNNFWTTARTENDIKEDGIFSDCRIKQGKTCQFAIDAGIIRCED